MCCFWCFDFQVELQLISLWGCVLIVMFDFQVELQLISQWGCVLIVMFWFSGWAPVDQSVRLCVDCHVLIFRLSSSWSVCEAVCWLSCFDFQVELQLISLWGCVLILMFWFSGWAPVDQSVSLCVDCHVLIFRLSSSWSVCEAVCWFSCFDFQVELQLISLWGCVLLLMFWFSGWAPVDQSVRLCVDCHVLIFRLSSSWSVCEAVCCLSCFDFQVELQLISLWGCVLILMFWFSGWAPVDQSVRLCVACHVLIFRLSSSWSVCEAVCWLSCFDFQARWRTCICPWTRSLRRSWGLPLWPSWSPSMQSRLTLSWMAACSRYVWLSVPCLSVCQSLCLYVCLSLCLSVCHSLCLYICLSLSVCRSLCLYVCLSLCLSVAPFVHMSVSLCLSVAPFVSMFAFPCLSVCHYYCLYVCISFCLSICFSICLCVCLSLCLSVRSRTHCEGFLLSSDCSQ